MQLITLNSEPEKKDWSMQFMDESHYDELITEECRINKPNGEPLLVLRKNPVPTTILSEALYALNKCNAKTENRSVASGIEARPRKRVDGSYSKTTRVPKGWEVTSGVVGYFERQIRFPYCHACAWNARNPELFNMILPVLKFCSEEFALAVPERFSVQSDYARRTHPDFVIPQTVYTTMTVNKNFRTAAHKDVGDLAAGFSNMLVLGEGWWAGANLVLPDWRLAVKLGHGDLVMFDAHEFHGNTSLLKLSKKARRTSLVMYYREKMVHCKSQSEELLYAKNRKPGDKLFAEEK